MKQLDPPPSILELVRENPTADYQWKAWLNRIFEWLIGEDWHEIGASGEPAFQNSWANEGSAGNETAAFKYRAGMLFFKGYIDSGTTTDGTVVFTLPEGRRPNSTIRVSGMFVNGSSEISYQLEIQTDGDVAIYGVSGATPILSLHAIVNLDN